MIIFDNKQLIINKVQAVTPCSRKCYEVHLWVYYTTTTESISFPAKFITLLLEKTISTSIDFSNSYNKSNVI